MLGQIFVAVLVLAVIYNYDDNNESDDGSSSSSSIL